MVNAPKQQQQNWGVEIANEHQHEEQGRQRVEAEVKAKTEEKKEEEEDKEEKQTSNTNRHALTNAGTNDDPAHQEDVLVLGEAHDQRAHGKDHGGHHDHRTSPQPVVQEAAHQRQHRRCRNGHTHLGGEKRGVGGWEG